jgi:hypothetical protein
LTSLPPEQQQAVWREAVETAPPSGITAKHVQQTVKRVKGATSTTTPAKAPRPDEPTAKKPFRIDVQERLFEALKSLPDPYAFSLFVRMYQWVDRYAIRHKGEIRGAAVRDNLNAIRERLTSTTWLSETTPDYVEIEWGEAPDMSHTPKM